MKKVYRKLLSINILCGFLFGINACAEQTPPQYLGEKKAFFDLKNFLEKEIKTGLETGKSVKKTVTVNGQSETKNMAITDWATELRPFLNADINRPAWQDKYLRKESRLENQDSVFEYYALRDALKVRHLIVQRNAAQTDYSIKILTAEKTAATETRTELFLDKKTGYSIKSAQKLMGSVDSARIEVVF